MTKRSFLILSLFACLGGSLAAGCAASAPPAATAAPLPSVTPILSPTDTPASRPTLTAIANAPAAATAAPLPSVTPLLSPTSTPVSGPTLTASASPSETPGTPGIAATGSFFALSVADLNASAKWYSEKLDMKIVNQPPKTNQAAVIVLEGEGLIVELIQQDHGVSLTQIAPSITDRTLVHGIVKAGAIVSDFDQTVALLRQRHVTIAFGPFPATAEQRANVIIQDNEGNLIQFFGK